MSQWVFIDKSFVTEENAHIHFRDLAIQRGYGVFDFFRLVDNQPVFINDHLERFYFSAEQMHLKVEFDKEELKTIIKELVDKNDLPFSGVRITLTGGYSPDGYQIISPTLIISQHSFASPNELQLKEGIRLISYEHQRQLPQVKSIDYLMAIWLQPLLKEKNADDLLYHQSGIISECPRSNFFIVTEENKIVTAAANILKGITRKKLLELYAEFQIEEREISLKEALHAREAFITSTTKLILPVYSIDGKVISKGQRGRVTEKLTNALTGLYAESYA